MVLKALLVFLPPLTSSSSASVASPSLTLSLCGTRMLGNLPRSSSSSSSAPPYQLRENRRTLLTCHKMGMNRQYKKGIGPEEANIKKKIQARQVQTNIKDTFSFQKSTFLSW